VFVQAIQPFLWFDDNAEEAVQFYVSVFKNAKAGIVTRYPEGGPGKPGSVMTATFTIGDVEFMALNGGPHFKFNESISFVIPCDSQAELDEMWDKLSAGGSEVQCGWLKDKFGLSWQVAPANMSELMQGKNPEGAKRAMQAMLQMKKLDIATLRRAGGLE
jgi:predicted 3-demethylubiquinone-9 3-methyltransferase (glyoxalase superfamily)